MRSILCIFLFFNQLLAFSGPSEVKCTKEEAIQAETQASSIRDWDTLHSSYRKFAKCDDGAIWEGYSESVSQILANHWELLSQLEKLIQSDTGFEAFVLKHIDETITRNSAIKIVENAKKKCPKESKGLCKKIEVAAKP